MLAGNQAAAADTVSLRWLAPIGDSMNGWPVLAGRSQPVDAPAERVWSLLSRPEAVALRPDSFAFDVAAPPAPRLRVVLSVPRTAPICVVYEVREEVPGQVVSLTLPGRPPGGGEVFTLSVAPERAGSQVAIHIRTAVADPGGQAVVAGYWQRALPLWLAGLRDVAEGRAPVPDGRMPAGLQAACTPAALAGRPASASASVAIAAPAQQVWEAVCAPESAMLMSRGGWVHAGAVPGTPVRQAGQMQYVISQLGDGQLRNTVTMVRELAAGRFVLISTVGGAPLEMLHRIEPHGRETRLELTYRWPAGIPDRRAVARSMTDAVRRKVRAVKELIENPDAARVSRPATP